MTAEQFMLWMCFGRILLMIGTIYWLIFRTTKDAQMRLVCATVCMIMLGSNILNACMSVGLLKVMPW